MNDYSLEDRGPFPGELSKIVFTTLSNFHPISFYIGSYCYGKADAVSSNTDVKNSCIYVTPHTYTFMVSSLGTEIATFILFFYDADSAAEILWRSSELW
jgi:hypothetical protein